MELPHVGETVAMFVKSREAGHPEQWIGSLGAFARRLYEPCAEILRFMRESGDADLIARYREIDAGRLRILAPLEPELAATGRLRAGLSGKAAVDVIWSMTSPAIYEQLVLDRGWTPDQFESWLGPALVGLILADSG
jgi:hypothetical protein